VKKNGLPQRHRGTERRRNSKEEAKEALDGD
jgi:hypothetical protein